MPLPTVLVTEVIRSSQQGESHGGAHLVDLETGEHRRVLDWDEMGIDWSGRGGGRGLRGIAFHEGRVIIGAGNEIFLFDPAFNLLSSHPAPYCRDCHEIHLDGDRLLITATGYDALLEFDLRTLEYTAGLHFMVEQAQVRTPQGTRKVPRVVAGAFDPSAPDGPPRVDTLHINMVWHERGHTFVCGTTLSAVLMTPAGGTLSARAGVCKPIARVPEWTHNARPFRGGALYNATRGEQIVWSDTQGNPVRTLPIPRFPREKLRNDGVPEDHARPDFGRGLTLHEDADGRTIVIGASSPSTITAYDLESAEVLASVNLTADVRNAPHGLEIWPF
jgi:hypothetical protein